MNEDLIIDENDMTAEMDTAIRSLLLQAFPADRDVFSKTRAWNGSGPAFSVALLRDGLLAAHVGVVDRTIDVGGTPVRAAGVQNVAVAGPFKGMGLARTAMDLAMAEAEKRGYDIGLLFCITVLEKVYAPMGWTKLENRTIVRVDGGEEKPLPGKNIAMARPLGAVIPTDGVIHLRGNDW